MPTGSAASSFCPPAARDVVVAVPVLVQHVLGVVDDPVEAGRHRDLRNAEVGARGEPAGRTVLDRRLAGVSDSHRGHRDRRVDQHVEIVPVQHVEQNEPHDVAHLHAPGDARRDDVAGVLPVAHRHRAPLAVVLRVGVQARPVGHRGVPAAHQVLGQVKAEAQGPRRAVDAAQVQVGRQRRGAFGRLHEIVAAGHVVAGHREPVLAVGVPGLDVLGHMNRQDLGYRPVKVVRHVRDRRVVRIRRVERLDDLRAELVAQHAKDLFIDEIAHRGVVVGVLDHVLPDDTDAHAGERPGPGGLVIDDEARVGRLGEQRAREGGVDVARIVEAAVGVPERVEDPGRVLDGAAVDAPPVEVGLDAGRSAVRHEPLGRHEADDAVAPGRLPARAAGLLADRAGDEVRADRHRRPRARAAGLAGRVVDVARGAGPAAAGDARAERPRCGDGAPRVAAAGVVLREVGLGVDDGALGAQLGDDRRVPRRSIHRVGGVGPARRAHVGRVEDILERDRGAVHRHPVQVGIPAVQRVELGRPLERVGLSSKRLAGGGAVRGQDAVRRVRVALGLAGHRALAAQVERAQRVELARVPHADDHAVLLLDAGVRPRGLHAPELDRQPPVVVVIRQNLAHRHGGGGELDGGAGPYGAPARRNPSPVRGDELRADAVVGPRTLDVGLDHLHTGRFARPDRALNAPDGGFFDLEALGRRGGRTHRPRAYERRAQSDHASHAIPLPARQRRHRLLLGPPIVAWGSAWRPTNPPVSLRLLRRRRRSTRRLLADRIVLSAIIIASGPRRQSVATRAGTGSRAPCTSRDGAA